MPFTSWLLEAAATCATAYALTKYGPAYSTLISPSLFKNFAALYSALLVWRIIYSRFIFPKWLSKLNNLPQPPGGSFWNGHFWECFGTGTGEMETSWVTNVPNKGFIYYLHILNTQRVIVCSPSAVQQLCVRADEFTKPRLILMLAEKFLGLGLVLAEGQQHRRQRRTFLPIFAPRHVREMYGIFWTKSREVTQKLAGIVSQSYSDGQGEKPVAVMEVGHWASRAALDIVTMATLGKDFGSVADEESLLAKCYREALEPTRGHLVQAMFKLFLPPWLVEAMPNRWNRAIREYIPIFRGVCRDLLIEKRNEVAAGDSKEKGKDLLSLCFQYEESANAGEEELIDQLATFLAAGHETISVGITWGVYMLCLHPEWQTLLREEARSYFPDPSGENGEPDPLQIESMPMMQAFVHEVLRWYPPIPETMREPLEDCVVDGQFLPKGMTLVVPIKGIMRHEQAFGPDANVFNPRRWLSEVPNADGTGTTLTFNNTGGASSKYANLSFMQGIRSCIAMNFAKAEMACIISAWVGRFSFELEDPALMDESNMKVSNGSFSGRPSAGLHVKWRVVDGW